MKKKVLSTGLTKFAADGSGMDLGTVVCSAAIMIKGPMMVAVEFKTQALAAT